MKYSFIFKNTPFDPVFLKTYLKNILRGGGNIFLLMKLNNKNGDVTVGREKSVKFFSPALHSWTWTCVHFFLCENVIWAFLVCFFRLLDGKKCSINVLIIYRSVYCPSMNLALLGILALLEFFNIQYICLMMHWVISMFVGWGTAYTDVQIAQIRCTIFNLQSVFFFCCFEWDRSWRLQHVAVNIPKVWFVFFSNKG